MFAPRLWLRDVTGHLPRALPTPNSVTRERASQVRTGIRAFLFFGLLQMRENVSDRFAQVAELRFDLSTAPFLFSASGILETASACAT